MKQKRKNKAKRGHTPTSSDGRRVLAWLLVPLIGIPVAVGWILGSMESERGVDAPRVVITNPMSPLQEARLAVDEGRFAQAVDAYTSALDGAVNPEAIYFDRAVAYYRIGEYDLALADYQQVTEDRTSRTHRAWAGIARIHFERYQQDQNETDLDAAHQAANRAVETGGTEFTPTEQRILADIYYEVERYSRALSFYQRYIELVDDPDPAIISRRDALQSTLSAN